MKRRSLIVALSVISALAVLPSGAAAATAPAAAPVLTSAPFGTLVSFSWTPGNGLNTSQSVFRSDGPCATPVSSGQIQPGSPYASISYTDPSFGEAKPASSFDWYRTHEDWWRPHKEAVEADYATRGQ